MTTVTLEIEDTCIKDFAHLLHLLPRDKVRATFTYTDDLGDTIQVVNGEEFVVPTEADERAYAIGMVELQAGETLSLEEVKKELAGG